MKKIIAIYLRLSSEDDDKEERGQESSSISNQRDLLTRFIKQHPDFEGWEIREFADDGFSGANEDRPAFREMIAQVKNHSISVVAVKDFSRFSRNYITAGEYLEQVFPFLGIRFISVNDHYDSKTSTSQADNMSMVLKSILNAYYCKEISKKIRATYDVNMRNHQSLRVAPFGYAVNEDRTGFVIDPEPAETVREIYRLSLSSLNFTEVTRVLNERHIPTPTSYNLTSNRKRTGSGVRMDTSFWSNGTVRTILRDPVYTGRLTLHKYTVAVPSTNKTRKIDSEDRYVFEDAHEPIISKEDFARVQELHPVRKSPAKAGKAHSPSARALTQHLFCGVCKRAMIPTNTRENTYYCRTSYTAEIGCRKGFLPEAALEQAVLSALLPMLQIFRLRAAGSSNGQTQIQKWLSECQKEIFQNQVKQQSLQRQKLDLYEQYTAGSLPLLPYQQQKQALNMELRELEGQAMKLMEQESTLRDGLVPAEWESISKAAERFQHAEVLTREMVDAFIERVEVYPDHIHIQWRFHDVWESVEASTKLLSDYTLADQSVNEGRRRH